MKYSIKKLYSIDGAGNGVAKDFDYAKVESSLNSIERNIANIMDALSKRITVTSYEGDAQEEVNNAVDSIRSYLATMEKPLNDMKGKKHSSCSRRHSSSKTSSSPISSCCRFSVPCRCSPLFSVC